MPEKKLDKKERRFVEEYLVDLNPVRAALVAGYSESMAASKAYQWVSNSKIKPRVTRAIQKGMDRRTKRTEVTQDRVIDEISKLAFGNVRNLYDDEGSLIPIQDLPEDVSATIQEYTQKSLGNDDGLVLERKYKVTDKKASLELLGRHLKLFTDVVELKRTPIDDMSEEELLEFIAEAKESIVKA